MLSTENLPFKLDQASQTEWLISLGSLNNVIAGDKLNKVIIQLRKHDDAKIMFPLLCNLVKITLHLSHSLAHIALQNESGKTEKIAKLSMQLSSHLALAFYEQIKSEKLDQHEKIKAAILALGFVGENLNLRHQFRLIPSTKLWLLSADIFNFAKKNALLNDEIEAIQDNFPGLNTIDAVLKRNILFSLMSTKSHSIEDSKELYAFASQYFDYLNLSAHYLNGCYFVWNLKTGLPEIIQSTAHIPSSDIIYIDISAFKDPVASQTLTSRLSKHTEEDLFHLLSGYNKLITDAIPSAPIIFHMFRGYTDISEFLLEREKILRIQSLSSRFDEQEKARKKAVSEQDLYLEPLAENNGFFSPLAINITDISEHNLFSQAESVKFIRTRNDNFVIAECKRNPFLIGHLVLLVNNKNALLLGVVRQIKKNKATEMSQLLIEKFSGEISVRLIHEGGDKKAVIIINELGQSPEIILSGEDTLPNSISLPDKNIRIHSLLEYTPAFKRYEIEFD